MRRSPKPNDRVRVLGIPAKSSSRHGSGIRVTPKKVAVLRYHVGSNPTLGFSGSYSIMVVRQILSLVAGVQYPVASRNIKVTLPYDEGR